MLILFQLPLFSTAYIVEFVSTAMICSRLINEINEMEMFQKYAF